MQHHHVHGVGHDMLCDTLKPDMHSILGARLLGERATPIWHTNKCVLPCDDAELPELRSGTSFSFVLDVAFLGTQRKLTAATRVVVAIVSAHTAKPARWFFDEGAVRILAHIANVMRP